MRNSLLLDNTIGRAFSHVERLHIAPQVKFWIRFVTFGFPLLLIGTVIFQPWVEPKWMFLDTLAAVELSNDCCHTYYGFMSNLGIMIWSGTSAICVFAAAIFAFSKVDVPLMRFSLSAGLLTGWLALDDAFLLHEVVMPKFGIPQTAVIATYALLAIIYIVASWRVIFSVDYLILLVGGSALVVSILVDTIFHSLVPSLVYIEDSAKFFGIVCWASFHITAVFTLLQKD